MLSFKPVISCIITQHGGTVGVDRVCGYVGVLIPVDHGSFKFSIHLPLSTRWY